MNNMMIIKMNKTHFFLMLSLLVNISCTNNMGSKLLAQSPSVFGSGISGGLPQNAAFSISQALRSNVDPTSTADVLGDNTGVVAQICAPQTAGAQGSTATPTSNCRCKFTYTTRQGYSESFESPVIYHESNLIRCIYNGVPRDSASVSLSVRLLDSNLISNEVPFPLSGTHSGLDATQYLNYLHVKRYQCTDAVYIPDTMDGPTAMYDPFLSEDPSMTYPLNYYTTNIGGTLSRFVELVKPTQGSGFLCPPDPTNLMNPYIYSLSPSNDPKMDTVIFPIEAQNEFDRFTFYLAKQPMGVFNVAFNTFVTPNTFTQEPSSSGTQPGGPPPSIGYAAAPYRISDGEEVCPSSNAGIPQGMRWVKVWQFRASLPNRTFKRSQALSSAAFSCNPGLWQLPDPDTGKIMPIISDCGANGGISVSSNGNLVDRVDNEGICVRLTRLSQPSSTNRCNSKPDIPITGAGCTNVEPVFTQNIFAPGTDIWQPYELEKRLFCGTPGRKDLLSLCNNRRAHLADPALDVILQLADDVPFDKQPSTIVDVDGGVTRFDVLYVVSPVSIMTKDFTTQSPLLPQNPSPNDTAKPYTPYRFFTSQDCLNTGNPDSCPREKKIFYGFINQDATQPKDAPRHLQPIFPLCALQPIPGAGL